MNQQYKQYPNGLISDPSPENVLLVASGCTFGESWFIVLARRLASYVAYSNKVEYISIAGCIIIIMIKMIDTFLLVY